MDNTVIESLRDAQRFGFFGDRPIEEAIEHSMSFVRALGELAAGTRIADMGSGGGLPGFVLASSYPLASVTMIDRRTKRTDFLHRAVKRLGWSHVDVVAGDVSIVVGEVESGMREPFDVVTARGFGPPDATLLLAVALVRVGGRIVISEPPQDERWDTGRLDDLGIDRTRVGAVSVFTRHT